MGAGLRQRQDVEPDQKLAQLDACNVAHEHGMPFRGLVVNDRLPGNREQRLFRTGGGTPTNPKQETSTGKADEGEGDAHRRVPAHACRYGPRTGVQHGLLCRLSTGPDLADLIPDFR